MFLNFKECIFLCILILIYFAIKYYYGRKKGAYIDLVSIPIPEHVKQLELPQEFHGKCSGGFFECQSPDCSECAEVCGSDYSPVVISSDEDVLIEGVKLHPGKWCLRKNPSTCLKATSILYYNGEEWKCMCKWPGIVGGEKCDKFIACTTKEGYNAPLKDRTTGKPINIFDDPNRNYYEVLNDGGYRYVCDCKSTKDAHKNELKNDMELFPFGCVTDICKNNLPDSAVPGLDFRKGCDCGDFNKTRQKNLMVGDLTTPCTACFIQKKNNVLLYPIPCYTLDTSVEEARKMWLPCDEENAVEGCYQARLRLRGFYGHPPQIDKSFILSPLKDT